MRFAIPGIPLLVTIERRPREAAKGRIRDLMAWIAFVAVILAAGMFIASLPDRVKGFRAMANRNRDAAFQAEFALSTQESTRKNFESRAQLLDRRGAEIAKEGDAGTADSLRREAATYRAIARAQADEAGRSRKRIAHFQTLADKYAKAAERPYLPVGPDPSEP